MINLNRFARTLLNNWNVTIYMKVRKRKIKQNIHKQDNIYKKYKLKNEGFLLNKDKEREKNDPKKIRDHSNQQK